MANIQPMNTEFEKDHEFDAEEKPSKSAVKREMLALQDLGKALCELPSDKLKRAPISDSLREAIGHYLRCKSFGAQKRQLQYIGKVMRSEEHEHISAWLQGETVEQKLQVLHMHAAEQWRDRLIADPALLATFIEHHPQAAQANLNPLLRQAVVEKTNNKAPKNARQLYKVLFELIKTRAADLS